MKSKVPICECCQRPLDPYFYKQKYCEFCACYLRRLKEKLQYYSREYKRLKLLKEKEKMLKGKGSKGGLNL